jgi:hypothetical protein
VTVSVTRVLMRPVRRMVGVISAGPCSTSSACWFASHRRGGPGPRPLAGLRCQQRAHDVDKAEL